MKLTPRLQAIADLIPPGSIVADIGTDHAYLPVYLLQEQISERAIAVDINQAPLDQAKETIEAFNYMQKIDIRKGNGLRVLNDEDHIDTVVIAGLGGESIAKILTEGKEKVVNLQRIILQPMSEAGFLRRFLAENGFTIMHEALAMEGRHLYEIILTKTGRELERDPFRLSFGPRLLEEKPPLLPTLLKEKIRKLHIVYQNLQQAKKEDVTAKLREVEHELHCLQEVLTGATKRTDTNEYP